MTDRLDPKLDVVFKILFSAPQNRDLLISLLTAVLQPSQPIVSAEVLNPYLVKDLVDQKGPILDVRVKLADGTEVDVEMQARHATDLRNRALYYWARMYGAQLSPGGLYKDLKPCVVIFILASRGLLEGRFHSTFELQEIHSGGRLSDQLQVHFVELPNLPKHSEGEDGMLTEWGKFFVARSDEELEELARRNPVMEKARGALDFLSAEPNMKEIARARELGEYAYNTEIYAAREEGHEEGLAEGLAKVRKAARKLLASGMSREQVAELLEIDPKELENT